MAKIKRLFNDPYDIVEEMVEGYVGAHKQYVKMCDLDEAQGRVVLANDAGTKDKVGVIIGGGSGHEPLFIGYVGEDFADAVVIGNINTSPSPDPCYAAAKACDNGKGCIYLYGNYAGDVMNFDMGAEKADEEDDIRVETVLVTDDVVSSENIPDRRGIAGDFFVFKVAGAKAATGADLDEVVAAAQKANDNTRSMGVAMSSATLPAKGGTIFDMEDGDMEIGMGIHGEPGIRRGKIDTADNVIDEIMEPILKDLPYVEGDEVYVLVNSLGATPLIDLHVCYRRVAQILEEKGIKVYKALVGPFACSMDMAGMSVTLMKLDDELKELIVLAEDRKEYFTDLDSAIGDGDHGINLSIGFREVNKNIEDWKGLSVRDFYNKVGTALLDKVGGSSGPLYGSFFMKFGLPIKTKGPDEGATFEEFIAMMEKGVEIIKKRGKSTTGEKTMLDTFVPAVETLRKEYEGGTPAKEAMEKAVEAGKAGLESTRNIVATKGRAMRLGERAIGHLDPGAASAAEILEVFYKDMPN